MLHDMATLSGQKADVLTSGDPVTSGDIRAARGAALRSARAAAGLSARELVERVNTRTPGSDLTDHALYAYERGRVLLSAEVAGRVAKVLKTPVGELLAGDPDYAERPGSVALPDTPAVVQDLPVSPATLAWLLPTRQDLLPKLRQLHATLGVLARQLRNARPGMTRPAYLLGTFDLALDESQSLLAHAGLTRAMRADRTWGIDQLQTLREALTNTHKALGRHRTALLDLDPLTTPPTAPASVQQKTYRDARHQLKLRARALRDATHAVRKLVASHA